MTEAPRDGSIVRRTKGQDRTSTWRVVRSYVEDPERRFGKGSKRRWGVDTDYSGWVCELISAHRTLGGWVANTGVSSVSHVEDLELVWEPPESVVAPVSEPDSKRPVDDFAFDPRLPIPQQVLGYMSAYPPVEIQETDPKLRELFSSIAEKLVELKSATRTIVANQRSDPHINQKKKVMAAIRFSVYDLKWTLAYRQFSPQDTAVQALARKRSHADRQSKEKGETHHLV